MEFDCGFKRISSGGISAGRGFIRKYITTITKGESIKPSTNPLMPKNGFTASYRSSFTINRRYRAWKTRPVPDRPALKRDFPIESRGNAAAIHRVVDGATGIYSAHKRVF